MGVLKVQTYDSLVERMQSAEVTYDAKRLFQVWKTAQEAYKDEQHWTGLPLMEHTMGVFEVLLPYKPDEDTVVACILHHLLQCKGWTLTDIEECFGENIRELVSGLHLLSHVTLRDRRRSVEDLRLMLLTVSDDIRTVLLVLCDRSFLLECLPRFSEEDRKQVAQDVLQLFAPVAARLGMYKLRYELELRAFPVVYPHDAERISEQLAQVEKQYGRSLADATKKLEKYLENEGVHVSLEMRQKKPYSIFRKMQQKSLTQVKQLYDLFAVRVVVQTDAECYQVLGLLHKVGRPVANRFKDYIAFPKPNGYQSLHTTLALLPGMEDESLFVEVQVRTVQMHHDAQYGVAAHWMYKEHGSAVRALQKVQLQSVLSSQQSLEGEEETNALADHIFVLTPSGEVVELPEGATPLDFAFQLHTDLGLSFRSATVNGSIVPLDYRLENGDIVEVLKRKTPQPSSQWMQLLKMASSRSKLKRFLYAQDRPRLVAEGRELVNIELRKYKLPLLDADLSILRICDGMVLTMSQREDLLMKIGQGSERALPLLYRLKALEGMLPVKASSKRSQDGQRIQGKKNGAQFEIEGDVPLPTRCAKCCKPAEWPHGLLMGGIGRNGVVVVHRRECGMLRHANTERTVRVWWPNNG
ncbi:hypothetical protein A2454_02475 [Candidatus Peribacteria bacterium RIFOXYC2_FULL_55_14]|nr:MAG: hypothetical protein A2454_02475 [Candidatus Peribacteria bacterium RIFOXYC2_FULL_55_14]